MSSRQLTIAETAVLEKGLNFAPTPNYMPISEIIVSTEQACSLLSFSETDHKKQSKKNLSPEQYTTLKNLKKKDFHTSSRQR